MKKISIIIPVYNCEKTIERTLKSIESQTYNEFEAIVVNDGSTDNSEKIVKNFIKNKEKFKLINQSNAGVSKARNTGLEICTGDYLCFVDGDDWIESNYFENIILDMKNCDMVFYSYNAISDSKKVISYSDNLNCDDRKEFFERLNNSGIFSPICSKVFSKEYILNCKFNEKMSRGEDADFTFQSFSKCKKIKYIRNAYYNYDINAGNLGFNFNNNKFITKIILYNKYEKFYSDNNWDMKFVNNLFAKSYILDLVNYNIVHGYNKKSFLNYKKSLDDEKSFDYKNISKKYYYPMLLIKTNLYFFIYCMSLLIRFTDLLYKKIKFGKK